MTARDDLMRADTIAEQLFFTTVRIDTIAEPSVSGSGTGFIVNYPVENQTAHFLVTNKHVVHGKSQGWVTFHTEADSKVNLGSGFRLEIGNWEDAWIGHPDADIDIAITPLNPMIEHIRAQHNVGVYYKAVPHSIFLNDDTVENLDALEQVTFIGYPNGIWDEVNQLPVVRRGMTASPLSLDFNGHPQFVIDASVFGGSSGSPVFLYSSGMYSDRAGSTIIGSRAIFVGVVTAVFFRTALNKVIRIPIPTSEQQMVEQSEMLDLGIVTKARAVSETIETFLVSKGLLSA